MSDIQVSENQRPLRILVVPANEGGCAFYRAINPYKKLAEKYPEKVEVKIEKNPLGWELDYKNRSQTENINKELFEWADVVMISNLSNFGAQYTCRCLGVAKEFKKFVHFDTDDLLTDLYPEHHLYGVYKEQGLADATKWLYGNADLVTVTQKSFVERIKPYCNGVLAYIKNAIDYDLNCWNLKKRDYGKVCHIGWAGGIHHKPDVERFNAVPHLLNQKVGREKVFFDFYGHPPMQLKEDPKEAWQIEAWKHYKKELMAAFKGRPNWNIHGALSPTHYGAFYANMDIAIAPLKDNNFNRSKSDIKVAECHAEGTKILLYSGEIKEVQDIIVGDQLMGPDSTPRNVHALVKGENSLYRITPNRGEPFDVTGGHILCLKHNLKHLLRYSKYPEYIEVSVEDYAKLSFTEKEIYKIYKTPVDFKEKDDFELDPYWLGLMLGDGNFSKGAPRITTMDSEIESYFMEYTQALEPDYILRVETKSNNKAKSMSYSCGYSCGPTRNKIMSRVEKLGLMNVTRKDKFIPDIYKTSSRRARLSLLAGLIDSDGHRVRGKNLYGFSNVSMKLIEDLTFVARSLGLSVSSPKKCIKTLPSGKHTYFRVMISGPVWKIPCKVERKKIHGDSRTVVRNNLTSGFSIEKLDGHHPYYGFQVDKDHKYLLGDFTVTHNCGRYAVPLVCSDVGCYNETIVNGETGFLIEPDAPKTHWINRLSYLVKNPKDRKRMGKNLKKITDEMFDLNKVVHLRLDVYDQAFKALGYNPYETKSE